MFIYDKPLDILKTNKKYPSYILDLVQQINQNFPNNQWRLVPRREKNSFRITNITETEAKAIVEFLSLHPELYQHAR